MNTDGYTQPVTGLPPEKDPSTKLLIAENSEKDKLIQRIKDMVTSLEKHKQKDIGTSITYKCKWPDDNDETEVTWRNNDPSANIQDIMHGFFTCLIGATWQPISIITAMREFAEEYIDIYENTKD